MTIELTKEQKELLSLIVNDKYSVGAFSGMIYNATINVMTSNKVVDMDYLIQQALEVRLKLVGMAKWNTLGKREFTLSLKMGTILWILS